LHWNPSSHRLSRFSLDYLLLPPRSVLMHDRNKITLCLLHILINYNASHQLTSNNIIFYYYYCRLYVYTLSAPLIFKAIAFARWVVTHSLADSKFHGHCPDVFIQQHFLWYLIMSVQSGTFKTRLSVHPASHILLTKKCPQIEKHIQKYNVHRIIILITPI